MIGELAEWSYPIGNTGIKLMVKDILDESKIVEKSFKSNIPGDDWVNAFCKRNKLSYRSVFNIKRSRAAVDQSITVFFDNLEVLEKIGMPFFQNKKSGETNFAVVKAIAFLTTSTVCKPLHPFPTQPVRCYNQWLSIEPKSSIVDGLLVVLQIIYTHPLNLGSLIQIPFICGVKNVLSHS